MIFDAYNSRQQMAWCQYHLNWKHKTLGGATNINMPDASALRRTQSHTSSVRMSPSLNRTCGPQWPGFESHRLCCLGGLAGMSLPQQELDSVDQLTQAIMLRWHALPQRLIDGSISEWRRRLQCVVDQKGGYYDIGHMFHWLSVL